MSLRLLAAAALVAATLPAQAAITLSSASSTYAQTFDSLANSGTANAWVNDSTLQGWSLFTAAGNAITAYAGNDGSVNTGSFYSYGTTSTTDRALGGSASGGTYFGSPASGAVAGYMALALTNSSGAAFDSFTISFDGEQWRNGGNASAQTMVLQYGFGATFGGVTTWTTAGSAFNWASPVTGTSAAAVNGNTAGRVANVGGTVTTNWAAGDTLWVRWVENNDTGNDHGLAIDNLSLSVSAVPEGDGLALALGGLALMGTLVRRRRG